MTVAVKLFFLLWLLLLLLVAFLMLLLWLLLCLSTKQMHYTNQPLWFHLVLLLFLLLSLWCQKSQIIVNVGQKVFSCVVCSVWVCVGLFVCMCVFLYFMTYKLRWKGESLCKKIFCLKFFVLHAEFYELNLCKNVPTNYRYY